MLGARGRPSAPRPRPPLRRYVVDAALVAKWLFQERGTPVAVALFDAWVDGRVDLLSPDLLVHELGALCRRKVRAGDLPAAQVDAAFKLLVAALPELVPSAELAPLAVQLAVRHDRAYADALHLALALREECPYVVSDDRLFRALAPAFPCVLHLNDVDLGAE